MKPKSLLADDDLSAPNRDDILLIMSQLRQACESDPTLERKWMLQMSKYVFHIVGDWHEKVSTSYREMEEKVEHLENQIVSIYNENRTRLNNQELSVNLCLKVSNTLFDTHIKQKGDLNAKSPTHDAGPPAARTGG